MDKKIGKTRCGYTAINPGKDYSNQNKLFESISGDKTLLYLSPRRFNSFI